MSTHTVEGELVSEAKAMIYEHKAPRGPASTSSTPSRLTGMERKRGKGGGNAGATHLPSWYADFTAKQRAQIHIDEIIANKTAMENFKRMFTLHKVGHMRTTGKRYGGRHGERYGRWGVIL